MVGRSLRSRPLARNCGAWSCASAMSMGDAASTGPATTSWSWSWSCTWSCLVVAVVLGDLDLEVEEEADRLLLDAVHHRGEHVEALALVLHERVALGVGPQVDALAQVVHLVEVLAPLAVEHREDDAPLELAHDLLADLGLATVVRRLDVLLEVRDQRLAAQPGATAGGRLDALGGQAARVELPERGEELVEVPVLGVALGRAGDVAGDDVVDEGADLLLEVGALEHPAALAVDDLALAAHHVVVLEDVLAGLEVLRLDLPWALAMAPVTRLFSIGTSSGTLSTCRTRSTQSDLKSRISSSSRDR